MCVSISCSVLPDSLQPHGLQPTRLLCPWDFPGKGTEVGCHSLKIMWGYNVLGIKWLGVFLLASVTWASPVAQLVKYPPAVPETWVRSLGWEVPLVKGTAIHSSILAWRIPWTIKSVGSQRVGRDLVTFTSGSGDKMHLAWLSNCKIIIF